MHHTDVIERVVDLTDPKKNVIYNMTVERAREFVAAGDAVGVRGIDGQFALVATTPLCPPLPRGGKGGLVRMARSIGRPLRYFIAKRKEGPCLVAADRIDTIHKFLSDEGLADQFHPSYTRMAPAHHVTEIALVGCPDPNPTYQRFFTPERNSLPADPVGIGERYVAALFDEVCKWLQHRATSGPIGVCFSGGIDSGSVWAVTYHAMLRLGMNPSRLKAFTLAVDGRGEDVEQARRFLDHVGLGLFLETIEVPRRAVDWQEAVRVVEDYKPLDIQCAAMGLALCRGIRERYPEWRYLIDGDGGDENLKDYPIEENPELTIKSVFNNLMLYHEGWGVDSVKHSLTYSGGLSRGYVRTYAPAARFGFEGFSPYTLPSVIEVAEGIPFVSLTDWDHHRLYELKGKIVAAGVKAVTGMEMPIFEKRRFQHGAAERDVAGRLFPAPETQYRRAFHEMYEKSAVVMS